MRLDQWLSRATPAFKRQGLTLGVHCNAVSLGKIQLLVHWGKYGKATEESSLAALREEAEAKIVVVRRILEELGIPDNTEESRSPDHHAWINASVSRYFGVYLSVQVKASLVFDCQLP